MIQLPRDFVTAIRTLTAIRIWGKEGKNFTGSLSYFSSVGLIIGALQYIGAYFIGDLFSPFVLASLVIAFHLLITRAFHLDGLADMADGFGGGWTKERVGEIMKDSRVGAFGAIAVAALLIVKTAGITQALELKMPLYLLYVPMFSRFSLVLISVLFPYAFEQGTAGEIINGARWYHAAANLIPITLIAAIVSPHSWQVLLLTLAVSAAAQIIIALISYRKIGGISGDILGASLEIGEAVMYLSAALFI